MRLWLAEWEGKSHCVAGGGVAILLGLNWSRRLVETYSFDKAYVDRLREGDPATEQHFVSYFGQCLGMMLRARFLPAERVDDIRQETFARVIANLRKAEGVRQPERFGAYVNSVCKNVMRESFRETGRTTALEDGHLDPPDRVLDIESALITEEAKRKALIILEKMTGRDRAVLRAIFLEEKDKDEVCREFGVDREYLRVLLHRAKERFRQLFDDPAGAAMARARTGGNLRAGDAGGGAA